MKLYHYTSAAHLRGIHQYGLTVGDVITSFQKLEGKVGVWLTTSLDPEGHGLSNSLVDKTEFRLTVEIDDNDPRLHKWEDWAKTNLDRGTQFQIHLADGWNSEYWYLLFGWVPPAKIVEVTSTKNGLRVENWGEYYPEVISARPVSYGNRHAWHRKTMRDVRRAMELMAS